MDGGTLKQLQNLINQKNIPSKPKKDLHSCEDFLELIGIGHVIATAKEILDGE